MSTESTTGVSLPAMLPGSTRGALVPVLEEIATCCVKHLRTGGYLSEAEGKELLTAYLCGLTSRNPPLDFVHFTAEAQARRHALSVDSEVTRMQRLLRHGVHERVAYWSFGALPGRVASLYEHCQPLREICAALGCPATVAGEASVIHVASVNPVSALVAASLISQELTREEDAEAPFIFPFLIDLPIWTSMLQRHFAA